MTPLTQLQPPPTSSTPTLQDKLRTQTFRKGTTHKLKPSPSDITAIGLSNSVVSPQDHLLNTVQRFIEIQNQAIRRSQRLQEKTPTARLESQMLNETSNNIPGEQEISDEDTIIYTSGSNGKPLLVLIKKEFDLNQVIRKFY